MQIRNRKIGPGQPVYVVAELSANHAQSLDIALETVVAARKAGADAIKVQTYTPDTMTIDSEKEAFKIRGTIWDGRGLYQLYRQAYMPWEWTAKLKSVANELGLDFFSTPFDASAVDFLEEVSVPVYKIASFEVVDIPLIEKVARTGKPVIMSTGMATLGEIDDALRAMRKAGAGHIALLKCTSAYPAPAKDMNLKTIPHLSQAFDVPVGLSDHTLGIAVPVAAVALGACIIEKHFILSRSISGPDSTFSLEPQEFSAMVESVRQIEQALGGVHYGATEFEIPSMAFRRSLFVVHDIRKGEEFTHENIRCIRPASGLPPRFLADILAKSATRDIEAGTPLSWDLVSGAGSRGN